MAEKQCTEAKRLTPRDSPVQLKHKKPTFISEQYWKTTSGNKQSQSLRLNTRKSEK